MATTMDREPGTRPGRAPLPPPPAAAKAPAWIDAAVAAVASHKDTWRRTTPGEAAALLERTLVATHAVAERWVRADAAHRGLSPGGPGFAMEYLLGPHFVLRTLRLLRASLLTLARLGRLRPPGPVRTRPDGRLRVGLFPTDRYDRLLFRGFSAEAWMQPGITAANLGEHVAAAYQARRDDPGRVCAVLGAGNLSSLAPNDALYALVVERQVVVLKLSPVLAYQEPILRRALAPLLEAGVLRLVQGGAEVATALSHHPAVDSVLLTGSGQTYGALIYGEGAEGARSEATGQPLLTKPVLAELGNVTPVLIVPGAWTRAELRHKAEELASSLAFNAGATCVTPRVVVTPRGWPQRGALLDALRAALCAIPTRPAYYPGSVERTARFLAAHPDADRLGEAAEGRAPWLLKTGLDPEREDEPAFREDPFCGVLTETALESDGSLEDYLERAVAFCNERLMGNLNAVLFAHPRSVRAPGAAAALERALAGLRYGNVVLNSGPGLPYLLAVPPWGAYGPEQQQHPVRSGTGYVHNTWMLDGVEKTVCRAPFRVRPRPPWFFSHRHQLEALQRLTTFEVRRDLRTLAPLLWSAAARSAL
ncbi:MAG TPA: aldehyde dehydrogenase family protein [Aggregicoccus sp.]|nr:aldehyde dehydrogenase family protein [Aggregicoccus sp.]